MAWFLWLILISYGSVFKFFQFSIADRAVETQSTAHLSILGIVFFLWNIAIRLGQRASQFKHYTEIILKHIGVFSRPSICKILDDQLSHQASSSLKSRLHLIERNFRVFRIQPREKKIFKIWNLRLPRIKRKTNHLKNKLPQDSGRFKSQTPLLSACTWFYNNTS